MHEYVMVPVSATVEYQIKKPTTGRSVCVRRLYRCHGEDAM